MQIFQSYYETLYQRPVVRLAGYSARHGLPASLYAYLAAGGPTNSAKDALAEGMLAIATEKGLLKPGQTVVEGSSGSFAVALAISCARSGHPLVLCMPATVPTERQHMLAKLGAKIALTNYVYGRRGVEKRAQEAVERTGGYYLNYFDNDCNAEFHRRVTGPNIARATEGALDAIVVGVGSGGTITGVGEYIKAWYPDVKIIAVEPYESQAIGGGFVGKHNIPGLGAGFVPENYNPYIVDGVVPVASNVANQTAQEVLRTDAVPASPSAGATLAAARELMEEKPELQRVLCIFAGKELYE
ncbi:cysteine synthase family protein [Ruthenibacterium sp. CLA-JM-H11]|uniref:Cysteine synthase family protein n=1 Tax=Ruthenibacterium intestinale TaxID=3133163 RepID=A0ABV1GG07_9FIRM